MRLAFCHLGPEGEAKEGRNYSRHNLKALITLKKGAERQPYAIRSPRMGMEKTDQVKACLEKAGDCERRALLATDETHRTTYLELARLWRDMAKQAERLHRRFSQPA